MADKKVNKWIVDKESLLEVEKAFSRDIDHTITIKQYIGEKIDEVESFVNGEDYSHYKYMNFLANMGSGKTTVAMDLAIKKGIKIVLTVPLKTIKNQKITKYLKGSPNALICDINGSNKDLNIVGTCEEEIDKYIKKDCNLYICVFDSIGKLINHPNFPTEDFVLICDEAHDYSTQFDFRYEAIQTITRYQSRFTKAIYLSGTHEATLPYEYKTIEFIQTEYTHTIKTDEFYIVQYGNDGLRKLFNLLMNAREGIKLILIDDIAVHSKLAKAIQKFRDWDDEKAEKDIGTISSKTPNPDLIEKLIKEQVGKEYIIATRIMAEGLDIFGYIDSIYTLHVKDFWLKRQFFGRCREGFRAAYDFLPYKVIQKQYWPNISELYYRKKEYAEEHLKTSNNKLKFERENNNINDTEDSPNKQGCLNHSYRYSEDSDYILSLSSILHRIIKEMNDRMITDPKMALAYYAQIAKINADFIKFEDLMVDKNFKLLDDSEYKDLMSEDRVSIEYPVDIDTLVLSYSSFLNMKRANCIKKRYIDRSMINPFTLPEVFETSYKAMISDNEKLFAVIDGFASDGYPAELILNLVNRCLDGELKVSELKKIRRKLGYYFDLQATYLYEDLEDLSKRYDALRPYLFLRVIHEKYRNVQKIVHKDEAAEIKKLYESYFPEKKRKRNPFTEIMQSIFDYGDHYGAYPEAGDESNSPSRKVKFRPVKSINLKQLLTKLDISIDHQTLQQMIKISSKRLIQKIHGIRDENIRYEFLAYQLLDELEEDIESTVIQEVEDDGLEWDFS
jgi:Type III restriction enzyme, res subunit